VKKVVKGEVAASPSEQRRKIIGFGKNSRQNAWCLAEFKFVSASAKRT